MLTIISAAYPDMWVIYGKQRSVISLGTSPNNQGLSFTQQVFFGGGDKVALSSRNT